jgi:hypothetical protein
LALSQTDFGAFIQNNYPEQVSIAKKIVDENRKGNETPETENLKNQIEQINNYSQFVDPSDLEARKSLADEVERLARNLQEESLYDWKLYYFKYLFNLSSHQSEMINSNPLDNEAFRVWFSGSKAVDSNGNPILLYHGTGVGGDEFDQFKFKLFPAAYFAENKSYAEWFTRVKQSKGLGILFKCYIRMTNPLDLSEFYTTTISYDELVLFIKLKYGYEMPQNNMLKALSERWGNEKWIWRYFRSAPDWLKYIRDKKEFDGVVFYENNPQDIVDGKENVTKAWVTFFDYQIKSADLRNTTFSLESGKITMEKGGKLC